MGRPSQLYLKDIGRTFIGDPEPVVSWYVYPKTGYMDVEVVYAYVPYFGEDLFPKHLGRHRSWLSTKILFKPDETFIEEQRDKGSSKYQFTSDNLLAIAQTKPTISAAEAVRNAGLVAEDVGPGRIHSVHFLLYNGPRFPSWQYEEQD